MTTTSTTRTDSNGHGRKTLASQLDRLEGVIDGLDAALAGVVQNAVSLAVKEAVQVVLAEVLTNRELQEELHQTAHPISPPEPPRGKKRTPNRLWQAAADGLHRTVQTVKKAGRGVGMALLAAGGVVVGVVYAARKRIASAASAVYRHGRTLLGKVGNALACLLPMFAFCST